VAFPTETVYGLAVRAGDRLARRKLSRIKGRPGRKPFQVLVTSLRRARELCGGMSPLASRLARAFWPGALTLVVRARNGRWVGLRFPDHPVARSLARRAGGALVATSANLSGGRPACTARAVVQALGARVDMVLDGGNAPLGRPSSVVRVQENGWELLREGAIRRRALTHAAGMPPVKHGGSS